MLSRKGKKKRGPSRSRKGSKRGGEKKKRKGRPFLDGYAHENEGGKRRKKDEGPAPSGGDARKKKKRGGEVDGRLLFIRPWGGGEKRKEVCAHRDSESGVVGKGKERGGKEEKKGQEPRFSLPPQQGKRSCRPARKRGEEGRRKLFLDTIIARSAGERKKEKKARRN